MVYGNFAIQNTNLKKSLLKNVLHGGCAVRANRMISSNMDAGPGDHIITGALRKENCAEHISRVRAEDKVLSGFPVARSRKTTILVYTSTMRQKRDNNNNYYYYYE